MEDGLKRLLTGITQISHGADGVVNSYKNGDMSELTRLMNIVTTSFKNSVHEIENAGGTVTREAAELVREIYTRVLQAMHAALIGIGMYHQHAPASQPQMQQLMVMQKLMNEMDELVKQHPRVPQFNSGHHDYVRYITKNLNYMLGNQGRIHASSYDEFLEYCKRHTCTTTFPLTPAVLNRFASHGKGSAETSTTKEVGTLRTRNYFDVSKTEPGAGTRSAGPQRAPHAMQPLQLDGIATALVLSVIMTVCTTLLSIR